MVPESGLDGRELHQQCCCRISRPSSSAACCYISRNGISQPLTCTQKRRMRRSLRRLIQNCVKRTSPLSPPAVNRLSSPAENSIWAEPLATQRSSHNSAKTLSKIYVYSVKRAFRRCFSTRTPCRRTRLGVTIMDTIFSP